MIRRLDAIDTTAHQIHQASGALEFKFPRTQIAAVPRHVSPFPGDLRHAARQHHHGCSPTDKVFGERSPEKPGASCDHDLA
jgi:hypothetical protein